ncbi:hypothetical protein EES40_32340 [Streptomyces sp. ADI93-02]|nr:hypothetical protein EES40_32340 [Streptomyces sp. ADI93-02]
MPGYVSESNSGTGAGPSGPPPVDASKCPLRKPNNTIGPSLPPGRAGRPYASRRPDAPGRSRPPARSEHGWPAALEGFYTGPVWREHRDAADATMVDSDDVLLLRGPGFTPPPGAGEVCATVCQPADAADFDAYAARHLGPGHALHRTEHAGNDSPLLPVRSAGSGLPDGWSGSGRTGRAPPASGTRSRIPAPGTAGSPVWERCRASPSARERVLPCRCCARPAYGCLCGRVVRSPALAMALTDAPIARLGVSDPRTWSAHDWASDVVPHVVHGLVTYGINRFRGATAVTPVRGEVARAGLIGAATGLRSTWGLAALSWAPDVVRPGIASRLSRPWVRIIVLAGATGEFMADKSPSTPDRLSPSGLVTRLLLGALTGAAVSGHRNSGGLPVAGGVAGAAASLAAARAGERRRTVRRHGM